MEIWKDTFIKQIPKDEYTIDLNNGEEEGLKIVLNGENDCHKVLLDFGAVSSYRLLDEGIVLNENLFNQDEVEKYKKDNFQSTIYRIENGEFSKFINDISNDMFDVYSMKHFIIITLNYVIEVVSSFEPTIKILNKE
ncbi:hypothetical protein IBB56_09935 [Listeria welshimeri]|uniref:hypothetical protein n=1 Tax=Listeria welshimeri TaxID=1643 RepID=UPI0010B733A6|nr:hypothetical protein [Listeria welshimeri]MBC1448705.1 hypothetical protein [Listeria welshimeri]MBC1495597.1 hypothetical protein [Listeria welshimeri]MBC1496312.1 hypothetical protein [Listeria welshimeri]MBC1637510.1 hypothetical protein [Listeria welshimeri]MBC1671756.1 hypothetical protein [Listeria welshimeri]